MRVNPINPASYNSRSDSSSTPSTGSSSLNASQVPATANVGSGGSGSNRLSSGNADFTHTAGGNSLAGAVYVTASPSVAVSHYQVFTQGSASTSTESVSLASYFTGVLQA